MKWSSWVLFQISIFPKNIDGMIAKFFELKSDISLKICFEKELMKKKLKRLKEWQEGDGDIKIYIPNLEIKTLKAEIFC